MRLSSLVLLTLIALLPLGCGKPPVAAPAQETVAFEGATTNALVRAGAPSDLTARLRIATRAPEKAGRVPVNVALLVDASGSMEGKPIADAIAASLAMVVGLAEGDRLAVEAFGSTTETLLASTELDGDSRAEARKRLGELRAQGTTDLAGGLQRAVDQVAGHLDAQGINRVVLLGDGVPNDESSIRNIASSAGARGIAITSLGLGLDYDETVMGTIAQLSGGKFRFVERSEQVAEFFQEEVLRLHTVYARNARVTLTPGPGVQVRSVVGQPTSVAGRQVTVGIGDLSRDDVRKLAVKLSVEPRRDGAPVELLDAVLVYEDPLAGGAEVERRLFLGAHASGDEARIESGRNAQLEDEVALLETAAATVSALQKQKTAGNEAASADLEHAASAAESQAQRTGNADLKKAATSLRELQQNLPEPGPAPASPSAARQRASQVVRSQHDAAMDLLQ
ncbi:MAG: VWA domain-containing protein [Polyangiaceae bacterium]